ncbi:MAG: hypothetical protein ACRYGF_16490 [Janthinobacterium lividum]
MPKYFAAEAAGADLRSPRSISVSISSRRVDDAVSPIRASKLVGQVTKALRKSPLKPVSDATSAELSLEVVVESHEQWGTVHSQNDPYIFFLLRNRADSQSLYCAYRRVGFSYGSAAKDLLRDLSARMAAAGQPNSGDVAACTAQAMRPVDLKL